MTSKPQTQHCIACRFPNRIKHCQGSHPDLRFGCTVSQHGIFLFRPLLEVMHYFISICISIWPQGLYIHLVLTVLRFFPNTILPKDGETKDVLHFEQLHASALGQNSEQSILHPTLFHSAGLHASSALQTAANVTIPVISGGECQRRRHNSKFKVIHRVRNEPPGIFDSSMSEDPKLSILPKQQEPKGRHYNGSAVHSLGTTDLTHRLGAFYPSPCCKCFPLFPHTAQPSSSFAPIMHVTFSGRGLHIFLRHSYFCTALLFRTCELFQRVQSCFFF